MTLRTCGRNRILQQIAWLIRPISTRSQRSSGHGYLRARSMSVCPTCRHTSTSTRVSKTLNPIVRLLPQSTKPGVSENDTAAQVGESSSSSSPIILRPYQESAIDACLSAIAAGKTRIGVSSPTGSGKTTMFMNLIPRFPTLKHRSRRKAKEHQGGSVLIVVSSVELAAQAEGAARKLLGPAWSVEVEQSSRSASGIADM